MKVEQLYHLLEKWRKNELSSKEASELKGWYASFDNVDVDEDYISKIQKEEYLQERYLELKAEMKSRIRRKQFLKITSYAAAAAVVVIACTLMFKWYGNNNKAAGKNITKTDIAPGHDGAILTLADGRKVVLDSIGNTTVALQGTAKVVNRNGQLVYDSGNASEKQLRYNTLSTPDGRQYKLVLPDGTKVWLNAGSSIRYPVAFNTKERLVEISGEAYFEVVHNAAVPFKVRARKNIIEDIGTSFDVNAYPDEEENKTTLLKGSVSVNGNVLQPGQEAGINNKSGKLSIKHVDTDDAIAWINGQLSLESEDVPTLMRRIARWYNVSIRFEGDIPHKSFFGSVNKNVYLSQVLNALKSYGMNVRQEGNVVIVSADQQ